MCGRFAVFLPAEAIAKLFGTINPLVNVAPSWNIAPTQQAIRRSRRRPSVRSTAETNSRRFRIPIRPSRCSETLCSTGPPLASVLYHPTPSASFNMRSASTAALVTPRVSRKAIAASRTPNPATIASSNETARSH